MVLQVFIYPIEKYIYYRHFITYMSKLNGEWLNMEQQTEQVQQVKRYMPKVEAKLITKLSKVLTMPENGITEESILSYDNIGIMDPSNCILVIAKTEEMKRLLSRFIDSGNHIYVSNRLNESDRLIPTLDYNTNSDVIARYSLFMLKEIISIFDAMDSIETINIKLKNDYPITLENAHLKIILAPRISNED